MYVTFLYNPKCNRLVDQISTVRKFKNRESSCAMFSRFQVYLVI